MKRSALLHVLPWIFATILWGLYAPSAGAQTEERSALEHRIKAAYLYKFADYVEWPDSAFPRPDTDFIIAVAGSDPVASELAALVPGRRVQGRPIAVRRVQGTDSLAGVHMLFIGRGEGPRAAALIRAAQQRSILVVTETEGHPPPGSAINFVIVEGRVRFDCSVEAARSAGLSLSSRLLSVAQSVRTP
jgi:hypothetical protein